MKKILVLGANGQIGTELKIMLRHKYGTLNVFSADLKPLDGDPNSVVLNALDKDGFKKIVEDNNIDTVYNLVALLSATGEKNPDVAWNINMGALVNTLEIARECNCSVFTPSSIGAFGMDAPKDNTPQNTPMHPNTIYGVCKVAGEMMGNYYFERFGVDARSARFPGLISSGSLPGGGTTDYAVEVFYSAIKGEKFICPIPHDRFMDMMYMPDALDVLHDLMTADSDRLVVRNAYNVASMSFSPEILFAEIKKHIPSFEWEYQIDPVKDAISNSWPNMMNDDCARNEWDWSPKWNLEKMVVDMIEKLSAKI